MTQTWDCADARPSLGVYVLGAIDPAERALVDAHLLTCRDCRDELAGLAGLPALLARVNPDEISRIRADDTVRTVTEDGNELTWQVNYLGPALVALGLMPLVRNSSVGRFVHVVRDVHSAVRALADPPLGSAGATGGTQVPARLRAKVSETEAVERWTSTTRACLEAQDRLGAKRIEVSSQMSVHSMGPHERNRGGDAGEQFRRRCLRERGGGNPVAIRAPVAVARGFE